MAVSIPPSQNPHHPLWTSPTGDATDFPCNLSDQQMATIFLHMQGHLEPQEVKSLRKVSEKMRFAISGDAMPLGTWKGYCIEPALRAAGVDALSRTGLRLLVIHRPDLALELLNSRSCHYLLRDKILLYAQSNLPPEYRSGFPEHDWGELLLKADEIIGQNIYLKDDFLEYNLLNVKLEEKRDIAQAAFEHDPELGKKFAETWNLFFAQLASEDAALICLDQYDDFDNLFVIWKHLKATNQLAGREEQFTEKFEALVEKAINENQSIELPLLLLAQREDETIEQLKKAYEPIDRLRLASQIAVDFPDVAKRLFRSVEDPLATAFPYELHLIAPFITEKDFDRLENVNPDFLSKLLENLVEFNPDLAFQFLQRYIARRAKARKLRAENIFPPLVKTNPEQTMALYQIFFSNRAREGKEDYLMPHQRFLKAVIEQKPDFTDKTTFRKICKEALQVPFMIAGPLMKTFSETLDAVHKALSPEEAIELYETLLEWVETFEIRTIRQEAKLALLIYCVDAERLIFEPLRQVTTQHLDSGSDTSD